MSNKKQKKTSDNGSPTLTSSEILELVDRQPKEVQNEVQTRFARRTERYSGPIPHPKMLKEFNDVIPDGANRIMAMAEKQSNHRQYIEKSIITTNNVTSILGVIFGGAVGLGALIGMFVLINNGKSIEGFVAGIVPLAALVGVFFKVKKDDELELKNKKENEDV